MEAVKESIACLAMLMFLFSLLVFGYAATPKQPSNGSEETFYGQ